ncbi:hypothetical protein [Maricaulis parjimensis]|uniref:hypothetical protein n=1 Tax=Maricaulis parjimensis TaxID=144023 RepID=UPI0019396E7A|nr:hypothetical protein [Maricaulis parjimensis]
MRIKASLWVFGLTLLLAVLTLAFPLALFGSPPEPAAPLQDGFKTPILAFEFATRVEHLAFLQGEAGAEMRTYLRHVQFLDWFFPVAYAGMAASFFMALALRGNFLALIGVGLALATIPADWQENATMNAILDEIENPVCNEATIPPERAGDYVLRDCLGEDALAEASPALDIASFALDSFLPLRVEMLRIDTWIKWGLIAAYAGWLAILFFLAKRPILAIPPTLAALSLGACWVAVMTGTGAGIAAELMSLVLIPFMLTFPVAAVMYVLGHKKRRR